MNNIIENYYYIIIFIGLFIIFTLVGYLVELIKRNKEKIKELKAEEISDKPLEDIVEEETKEEEIKEEVNTISDDDELLNDYNSVENKKE